MKYIIPLLLISMLILSACSSATVGGTTGSGGTSVYATGRTGGTISIGVHDDYLYTRNRDAYSVNKQGLDALRKEDYEAAAELFKTNLDNNPGNSDATFYLGLSLIYLGQRDEGFDLLASYEDNYSSRIRNEVRWWADYCRKKPEMTPLKINRTMSTKRYEAYREVERLKWERRRDRW